MANDEYWMGKALILAKKAADQDEVPVGALVVLENKVVSSAFNKKEQWHTPIGHAEIIALHRAAKKLGRWRLSDATLYVTLEPCAMCAGALIQARIGRIVFATKDPKGGALGSVYEIGLDKKLNHTFTVTNGVLQEKAANLLKDFFKKKRSL